MKSFFSGVKFFKNKLTSAFSPKNFYLLNLPDEMILLILDHADDQSLKSLRLTCRKLDAMIWELYQNRTRKFFCKEAVKFLMFGDNQFYFQCFLSSFKFPNFLDLSYIQYKGKLVFEQPSLACYQLENFKHYFTKCTYRKETRNDAIDKKIKQNHGIIFVTHSNTSYEKFLKFKNDFIDAMLYFKLKLPYIFILIQTKSEFNKQIENDMQDLANSFNANFFVVQNEYKHMNSVLNTFHENVYDNVLSWENPNIQPDYTKFLK